MKIEEARKRVIAISNCHHDNVVAHIEEDEIFYDFVSAVRNGKYETMKEVKDVAKEVFKVRDIQFVRLHA